MGKRTWAKPAGPSCEKGEKRGKQPRASFEYSNVFYFSWFGLNSKLN
jgi:hypothetical protein